MEGRTLGQYIPLKVSKFGIKSQELCESSSGYLWSFTVYIGKTTVPNSTYFRWHKQNSSICVVTCGAYAEKGPQAVDDFKLHGGGNKKKANDTWTGKWKSSISYRLQQTHGKSWSERSTPSTAYFGRKENDWYIKMVRKLLSVTIQNCMNVLCKFRPVQNRQSLWSPSHTTHIQFNTTIW